MTARRVMFLLLGVALACQSPPEPGHTEGDPRDPEGISDSACKMPAQTTTILDEDGAILEVWELRLDQVATTTDLPREPAFVAYRKAIEQDGADVVRPVADPPEIRTEAEAEIWRDEFFNNDLVFDGGVGSIEPISCLDALLFSRQASRISQIDHPTEFIASVLRREAETGPDLLVVFGAGSEMFPLREVYGFEVVDSFLAEGWSYWYAIHNHTVQKNGNRIALGVPVPSTTDVQLYRSLAEEMGWSRSGLRTGSTRSARRSTTCRRSDRDSRDGVAREARVGGCPTLLLERRPDGSQEPGTLQELRLKLRELNARRATGISPTRVAFRPGITQP